MIINKLIILLKTIMKNKEKLRELMWFNSYIKNEENKKVIKLNTKIINNFISNMNSNNLFYYVNNKTKEHINKFLNK